MNHKESWRGKNMESKSPKLVSNIVLDSREFGVTSSGDAVPKSKKYIIQVFSVCGREVRSFGTYPLLKETIKRANEFGLDGTKLLLADNGCQVCDDKALQFYCDTNHKFVLSHETNRAISHAWNAIVKSGAYR